MTLFDNTEFCWNLEAFGVILFSGVSIKTPLYWYAKMIIFILKMLFIRESRAICACVYLWIFFLEGAAGLIRYSSLHHNGFLPAWWSVVGENELEFHILKTFSKIWKWFFMWGWVVGVKSRPWSNARWPSGNLVESFLFSAAKDPVGHPARADLHPLKLQRGITVRCRTFRWKRSAYDC